MSPATATAVADAVGRGLTEASVRSVKAANLRAGHRLHRTSGVQTISDVQTLRGALKGEQRKVVLAGGDVEMFDPEERVSVSSETVESRVADAVAEELGVVEAADSLAKASTPEPFSSSKTSNWVARAGGLPPYIQHIAHDLVEKRGKSESNAIQMAIGIVKRWARGGGNVDANTRAAASKAVAQWEAMKAKTKAKSVAEAAELAVLETWWDASEDAAVIAEAAHYEAARDDLLALTEAASSKDDADGDEGKMNSGKRADGLKVKCPKCGKSVVPKDGKCPHDGTDLSKLARFAKSLKSKTQEAAEDQLHPAGLAVREALEEL